MTRIKKSTEQCTTSSLSLNDLCQESNIQDIKTIFKKHDIPLPCTDKRYKQNWIETLLDFVNDHRTDFKTIICLDLNKFINLQKDHECNKIVQKTTTMEESDQKQSNSKDLERQMENTISATLNTKQLRLICDKLSIKPLGDGREKVSYVKALSTFVFELSK